MRDIENTKKRVWKQNACNMQYIFKVYGSKMCKWNEKVGEI